MTFPTLSPAQRLARLQPPTGKVRAVLDTDTYNEIDDQFAVVHALRSPDRLNIEAIYAAPFHNARASGPGDGMERSYDEILQLLRRLNVDHEGFVWRGSATFLVDGQTPCDSEAARELVTRALATRSTPEAGPLYVIAIGAITNVASAILLEPEIINDIVVVWLGGHALYWPHTVEFNLKQDIHAARLLFDCGVPLILIPCVPVASHLLTTVPEIERYVEGKGEIGDFLAMRFKEYSDDHQAWAKEIWDISATAWPINSDWVPTILDHSPILTDQITWSVDRSRHMIRVATQVKRNPIFRDLFDKLALSA